MPTALDRSAPSAERSRVGQQVSEEDEGNPDGIFALREAHGEWERPAASEAERGEA